MAVRISLGLTFSLCLISVQFTEAGLNASWLYPTVGCFANPSDALTATNNTICPTASVCADAYLKVQFGGTVSFSLAATDNSSSIFKTDPVKHCNDATIALTCDGCNPLIVPQCSLNPIRTSQCLSRSCHPTIIERVFSNSVGDPQSGGTGFEGMADDSMPSDFLDLQQPTFYGSPYIGYRRSESVQALYAAPIANSPRARVVNLYPQYNNLTRADFSWTVPALEDLTILPLPLYQLKYRARYGAGPPYNLVNTSSCNKTIYVRLCSPPTFFTIGSKLVDSANRSFFLNSLSPAWTDNITASDPNATLWNFTDLATSTSCGSILRRPCLTPLLATTGSDGRRLVVSTLQESVPTTDGAVAAAPAMGVRVGQPLSFTISASVLDPLNRAGLTILIFKDPGLPVGMTYGAQYTCGASGRRVCVDLAWTPHAGQEGAVHELRATALQATSASIPAANAPCDASEGTRLLIRIPVTAASNTWVQPAASVTLDSKDPGNAAVGQRFATSLRCRSNYEPLVEVDSTDAQRGQLTRLQSFYEGGGTWAVDYNFTFTPQRGDEGTTRSMCFRCRDGARSSPGQRVCVDVRTRLCTYTVQAGDTFKSLTRRYQLNTNWLNLWNANPAVTDPDLLLVPGSRVRLGPVYLSRAGDTLSSVSASFSTTVKLLLSVNPALSLLPDDLLPTSTAICLLPCTSPTVV